MHVFLPSCSQEQILAMKYTQNYDVEGFSCRGTSLCLSLQQSVRRLTNTHCFNNHGSPVRGESICFEDKKSKLFCIAYITQNPKIVWKKVNYEI